ncbi:hypothetical protein V2J09_006669 [Rumex salicifolius]
MGRVWIGSITVLILFVSTITLASASIVEHAFIVKNLTVTKLCETRVITAVNDTSPGPLIHVHEGDTLVVHKGVAFLYQPNII